MVCKKCGNVTIGLEEYCEECQLEMAKENARLSGGKAAWLWICFGINVLFMLLCIFLFQAGAAKSVFGGFYFLGFACCLLSALSFFLIIKKKQLGVILSYVAIILGIVCAVFFACGYLTDGFDSGLSISIAQAFEKASSSLIVAEEPSLIAKILGATFGQDFGTNSLLQMMPTIICVFTYVIAIAFPLITRLSMKNFCRALKTIKDLKR